MTGPGAEVSKQRLRFWLQLLKASKHVENEIRNRLRREFATTLPRFDVMAMLFKSGQGLKMSQLSGELMVSNGNVTGIVDRLVSEDLIERVAIKGDRRATLVRLTDTGTDIFGKMAEAHEVWVSEILGEIDETDMDCATELLAQIREITQ
jgi:DNA-binding MarR family transcriptional regulator